MGSLLDPGQIIKQAFDDSTGRIKVDAEVTATIVGLQEVIISAVDDSIKIGDGTGHFLAVQADGSINTNVTISGVATEETLSNLNGKITAINTGAVVVSSSTLPSGASTSVKQDTGNTSLSSIDTKLSGTLSVTGSLTDTQLRASSIPISATSLPLPTGASTEATLSTLNSKIATVNTSAVTISTSLPAGTNTIGKLSLNDGIDIGDVTINNASGSSAVNIQDGGNSITVDGTVGATQSGTWNVTNVSGTVSLPTGASTSGKQDTGNTSVASIDTKTPALGQGVMTASSPVVIASNQSAIPVSQSGTWTIQPGNTANTTAWKVDGSAVTQPVSATNLDVALSTRLKPADTLTAVTTVGTITNVVHIDDNTGSLTVDNAGTFAVQATQSGTWNINNVSGTVSLPTGAATNSSLTTINTTLGSPFQAGGSIGNTSFTATQATGTNLHVVVDSAPTTAVTGTFFPAIQPVSFSTTSSSSITSVSSSASNITLLTSTATRKMATVYNDSSATLYLKFGATSSTSSYTLQIPASGYFEFPLPVYTGVVDGIWASANGNARITELT